jgi:heat shock protein HslJ
MIMGASGMSTMMTGTPEMMAQEKKFLDAMPMMTKYMVEGAKVMLSSDDGKMMMELAVPVTM